MAEKMSLALSDGLFELRRSLSSAFPAGGMVLDDEQTSNLLDLLKEFGVMSRKLENEVSRSRWNKAAHAERLAEAKRVMAEVDRPGTNVALFPVIHRPFSDGWPTGAS